MSTYLNQAQHVLLCDCQNPVEFSCKRCQVRLCEACLPVHTRLKTENGHAIVEYFTEDDEDNECSCALHPEFDRGAFCETCGIPVCLLCVSFDHKSHVISELTNKIPELLETVTRENLRLESLSNSYERALQYINTRNENIEENYQKMTDNVKQRLVFLKQEIEKAGEQLLTDLKELEEEHKDKMEKQRVEVVDKLDQLRKFRSKIPTKQNINSALKLLKLGKDLEEFNSLPQIEDATMPSIISRFEVEKELRKYFGNLAIPEHFQVYLPETESTKGILTVLNPPQLSATVDTKFPPRLNQNRLFDLVFMRGHKFWAGGSVQKLKLFDFNGNLLDIKPIESECGLYLTLHKGKLVFNNYMFNRLDAIENDAGQTTSTCIIDFGVCCTGWSASGIASTRAGDFLVCMKQNEKLMKIVRFSRHGKTIQEIQFDSKNRPLYKKLVYVAENGNGDVCAADWGRKVIVVVDESGQYRFTYRGHLKEDSLVGGSLTTDSLCNIIVADCLGDKIHVINKDGFFLWYIIVPELDSPRALSVTDEGELLVGECRSGLVKCIKYLK
ncbi:E3 ubiquitin-protein ligase TRIM71-like [Saccostrea echinata]|uniref:E3 ubiquitin-protein ligase TRIM71-like n=1 Tax=Saccostrea echinata TaxID=191078 RepID=UPI002A84075F|nr:E3 ubiquitin-protein ligase TRIM71-like [Saccostrea echinata]